MMLLTHKVEIYVPVNDKAQSEVAQRTFKQFCEYFGGAIMTIAKGGCINDSRTLVEDTIAIIYSFTPHGDIGTEKLVKAVATSIKQELDEDTVTMVIDNKVISI